MTTSLQNILTSKVSTLKATLLVTGTCIGGGMLAMPIQTAEIGIWVSSLVLFLSWAFMTFTGLLLVETTLWVKERAHFSSLSRFLLGKFGKALSILVYLFMNVSSLVAYTSGGALLIDGWLRNLLGISLGYGFCCALFTLLFGGFVYLGVAFVGRANHWFSCLMGIFFLYLIGLGFFRMEPELLVFRSAWTSALHAFPLILAAFSYQMIVPSLCSYLDYDVKALKKAVAIGTSLPFGIYFLWLLVIHGLLPLEGIGGLKESAQNGSMIVEPLRMHLASPSLSWVVDGFAFFALITSYLGLSIAFFDFLADLFKEMRIFPSKNRITFFSLIPCLFLSIFFPNALLDFLDLSGGFGDALLSGLIPIGMVWVGRYKKGLINEYITPGGKTALVLAALFFFTIFIVQWVKLMQY